MIKMDMKAGFFDSERIKKAVPKAQRKVLSRFGAFVRTRSRTSIRKRKGTSVPGGPPYSKTGLLKRFIYFAYDLQARSVVIGPQRLSSVKDPDAPNRIEYGGSVRAQSREIWVNGQAERDSKTGRFRPGSKKKIVITGQMTYQPRPFMTPALKAELPGLPGMWRDSIRP